MDPKSANWGEQNQYQLGGRRPSKKRNKKTTTTKTKKSHTQERKEPYDALERTERKKSNHKRKKPQET